MKAARLLEYILNLANAFYRALLKISINAHQVIAHWRIRIHRKQSVVSTPPVETTTNVRLTSQKTISFNNQSTTETELRALENQHTDPAIDSNLKKFQLYKLQNVGQPSQSTGLTSKTPNSHRVKIHSIFRRLSLRRFMEYCVIALNEASSSSCSNKFDLSSCDRPVWLLGKQYELPQDVDKLVDDIRSKLWITYRRNFPPIDENTRYTTDRGFGCMIRCGQMVLANALLQKNLGRDWRWSPKGLEANPDIYSKVLKLFQDKEESLYSIHNIVQVGQQEGKVIGEWFGPNTIAQALKRISMANQTESTLCNEVMISIDAALDNVVVIDEIKSKFKRRKIPHETEERSTARHEDESTSSGGHSEDNFKTQWTSGILFIQLRLGLTKINPLYFTALKKTFQFKNSLGIIGGRPNHALYLIGYTDDEIIYLDPHSTQQYVDFDKNSEELDEHWLSEDQKTLSIDSTYHCACPEKMQIDRLDPSLALCFYFHTEMDFNEWCGLSNELLIKSEQAPMFEITESRPTGWKVATNSSGGLVTSSYASSSCQIRKNRLDELNEKPLIQTNLIDQKFVTLNESSEDEAVDAIGLESAETERPLDKTMLDDEEFEMLG